MKPYLFEHWSYKPTWHGLSEGERAAFAARISDAVQEIATASSRLPRNACCSHSHPGLPCSRNNHRRGPWNARADEARKNPRHADVLH